MHCLRVIAAASACLGIMPGVASTSPGAPFHDFLGCVSLTAPYNVYATVNGAWIASSVSMQGAADRLFRLLEQVELVCDAAGFGDDLHTQSRNILVEMEDAELRNRPMHAVHPWLFDTPDVLHQLASDLGQQNDEIVASQLEGGLRECIQLSCTDFYNLVTADLSSQSSRHAQF